jgi:arginyl-tRNA synthetase
MDFRTMIAGLLEESGVQDAPLEVPPDPKLGHYAMPCFLLAKERKKAPPMIAQELAKELDARKPEFLERVAATGPYINFFIAPAARASAVIGAVRVGEFWGAPRGTRRIMIEYPSPNTNKPLHLGHVRNMVLGSTLVLLLKSDGNTVIQVNLTNDRGVHICKSMLAYERWGSGKEPDKKSDHFVGGYYVKFAQAAKDDPTLEEAAQAMLVKWEENDPAVRALWEKMNAWALSGQHATYERYGVSFDKEYYESEIYKEGKRIVLEHMDVLVKDETGAVIAPLKDRFGLPDKVLLRKDGTSIYMTQDIALTMKKMQEFSPDLQIWVVGNEQNLHFQQLFAVLELFGVKGRESFFHLSYGMVELPSGKMKSREGTVIDADDIIDELESEAAMEIAKRHDDWSQERIAAVSKTVAMGALRFFMIKYDPARDFVFDPKSSLSFEGDTGPYLQYTHARICSILDKAGKTLTADTSTQESSLDTSETNDEKEFNDGTNETDEKQINETTDQSRGNVAALIANADVSVLTAPEEQELLRQLAAMPPLYRRAVDELKPSMVANALLEIGRAFNGFYHACPVLSAEGQSKVARLALIDATKQVIADGLKLLGIEAPQEM